MVLNVSQYEDLKMTNKGGQFGKKSTQCKSIGWCIIAVSPHSMTPNLSYLSWMDNQTHSQPSLQNVSMTLSRDLSRSQCVKLIHHLEECLPAGSKHLVLYVGTKLTFKWFQVLKNRSIGRLILKIPSTGTISLYFNLKWPSMPAWHTPRSRYCTRNFGELVDNSPANGFKP